MNGAELYPCKTCSHMRFSLITWLLLEPGYQQCNRPNRRRDPVTGELDKETCQYARKATCGYEGRYHTERPENKE